MTTFLNKFKKPCFWAIFGPFYQFCGQKIFSAKFGPAMHNFIWASRTMPKFRKKLMIRFQENAQTDRRMKTEAWKDPIL